jgi:hypothetical protein
MPAAVLSLAMLEAQGFTQQSLPVDGRDRTVYANSFEPVDDFVLDVLTNAAGEFLDEDDVEGARLVVFVDENLDELAWRLEDPESELDGLERRYPLPAEEAYAVRFLNDYLGVDLPVAVARIGDSYGVNNGCLNINGRPVVVEYPRTERINAVIKREGEMPAMSYIGADGSIQTIELEAVVGSWA